MDYSMKSFVDYLKERARREALNQLAESSGFGSLVAVKGAGGVRVYSFQRGSIVLCRWSDAELVGQDTTLHGNAVVV